LSKGGILAGACVPALLALGGCLSPEGYSGDADAEVAAMLDRAQSDVLGGREQDLLQPAPAAPPEPAPAAPAEPGAQDPDTGQPDEGAHAGSGQRATEAELTAPLDSTATDALRLDLATSLATAVGSGRDYQNRRESLFLTGLGVSLTRYNFGPVLNGTISALWSNSHAAPNDTALAGGLGVSSILPTGGTFGIEGSVSGSQVGGNPDGGDPGYDSTLAFALTQPLLRGAGYLVSHEALTQAERNLVYAVRDFELFRQDFAIGVARDYYDLVSRRKRLVNLEQNWRDSVFDRNKSEALRQVDRNQDEDVFLARRREIDAENALLEARTDYQLALDDFKIALGLPTAAEVVVVDEEPPFRPVALDEASAVQVALANRLDLQSAREQLEDVERGLLIARDGLRPDLGLTLGYGLSDSAGALQHVTPETDQWETSAALVLELPLDRQSERNAYRSAQIALDRGRRDLQLTFDSVERDVRAQLRGLKQVEQQIQLQTEQIAQEQRAVAVTQIRYESGDADSRDLLDARQSLVDAQNELINLKARHVIVRLTLLRTLGVLLLGDDGMWKE
jgi:outer membrane protein TolC